ncbi:MAG: DUF5667 domain-containing protein [Anaerolineae bacterium]
MIDFDRIVDDAFSRLEAGQPIEAVLNQYPQQTEALRPLLETVSLSLHAYTYTEPASRAGMARGRQRFLSEAARRAEKRRTRQRPLAWLWPARRWAVTVAALLVLFLAASTTAVVASANSLPGSPLYPVKIAAEEVRLTLTRAPEPRARLHMERAQRRNQELNALLAQEAPVGGELLVSSLNEAEAALQELSHVPAELRSEALETYAAFAAAQADALELARDRMTPAQQPLLDSTADQYRRLADVARNAQTNPDTLAPTAVPWPTSTPTSTPTTTAQRPTDKATQHAGPAAVTTRRSPSRPTPTPTRRVHPTDATPTHAPTRRTPAQTPASAITPADTGSVAATLDVRPTATSTPRLSDHTWTRTPSLTDVRRPTRTATRTPRPAATALATPRPHRPSPTPTATRRKPRPTPTPTRRRPTPTATRGHEPTPTPTRERDLTPTPTRRDTRPTPTQQPEPTSTPPAVATALPTANLPALPTPTPPSAVATAAPTAALPAFPTPTPALAP